MHPARIQHKAPRCREQAGLSFANAGEIVDHHVVQNPWFYGWGIRYFGHGWLYNVSGPHAVEILLAKTIRIGTDEPQKLDRAIAQAGG